MASKKSKKEDPFAFPSDTQFNYKHHEMHKGRKIAVESNNLNQPSSNSEEPETGKLPNDDSAEIIMLPNKRQNTQDHSTSLQNDEKTLMKDYSCDRRTNIEQSEEAQHVSKSSVAVVESPGKMIPEFRLPPELAPFNNPGVCDYGVIRTSRLRNRRKKTDAPENVLYQNIQGQRRCRATGDEQNMIGKGNNKRCLNCAEGVFKYCHTHRDLDEDQGAFWDKRKRREESIRIS